MFTSTKTEGIMKEQKRYHLLPYDKTKPDIYYNAPYHIKEEQKEKRLVLRKNLSKCRKSSVDMSKFG